MDFGEPSSSIEQGSDTQETCLNCIKQTGTFEKIESFVKRINILKRELCDYWHKTKGNSKLVLISHPSVLETLTATGFHENGKLINSVSFEFGQLKREHVWIEGLHVGKEEFNTPICG